MVKMSALVQNVREWLEIGEKPVENSQKLIKSCGGIKLAKKG
jgi:hypothetical protein